MKYPQCQRWRWLVGTALLVGLYLLPRLIDLDAAVITDESLWLERSAHFYGALATANFADTFQFAHPGVTTMWAGMVGVAFTAPDYLILYAGDLFQDRKIFEQLRMLGHNELDILNAARIAKILLQAVLFTISLIYLRRLFGSLVAAAAGIMISLDPFLIAHDRFLHVDGLFAISCFSAVLALADALTSDNESVHPWIIAGALAAVAWLTRSTGVVLVGVLAISQLVMLIRVDAHSMPLRQRLSRHLRPATIWAGSAALTTVAMWPALWVAPRSTLSFVFNWAADAASEGHEFPTFFNGTVYSGDPGIWFYPTTILWRLTLAGTLGLALFVILLIARRVHREFSRRAIATIGVLTLFALLYVIGMSFGAKKFDRYLLPIYPIINLIAALGLIGAVRYAIRVRPSLRNAAFGSLLAILVLAQALPTIRSSPYFLDVYNPLLGGTSSAEDVMQMGWGEGTREAAEFIIEDSDVRPGANPDDPPVVRFSGSAGPLAYYFPSPFVLETGSFRTASDWRQTDYYVTSIQHWQRHMFADVIPYLEQFTPAYTVTIQDVPFLKVYKLSSIPPPEYLPETLSCRVRFGDTVLLENVTHDAESVTLWFRTIAAESPRAHDVEVELQQYEGEAPPNSTSSTKTFDPAQQYRIVKGITFPVSDTSFDLTDPFSLRIAVIDPDSGERLDIRGVDNPGGENRPTVRSSCGTTPVTMTHDTW